MGVVPLWFYRQARRYTMSRSRKFALLMLLSIGSTTFAMAQNEPPSGAMPAPRSTEPNAASSPHQQQAMHEQMMKDCMKKEHQKDASMSKDQLKKYCQDQMKMKQPSG
jgi:hypothetical protein